MNEFRKFLGRISSEICLKMNYFGSKSTKISKRWGQLKKPANTQLLPVILQANSGQNSRPLVTYSPITIEIGACERLLANMSLANLFETAT